jgi:hypothetical protein
MILFEAIAPLFFGFIIYIFITEVFGKPILKDSPMILAIKEKQRILERHRQEWITTISLLGMGDTSFATKNIKEIDKQLLELADEESAILMGEKKINDIS